jgi:hypothetical protein
MSPSVSSSQTSSQTKIQEQHQQQQQPEIPIKDFDPSHEYMINKIITRLESTSKLNDNKNPKRLSFTNNNLSPNESNRQRLPPTTLPPPLPIISPTNRHSMSPISVQNSIQNATLQQQQQQRPQSFQLLNHNQTNNSSSNDEYQTVPEYEVITSMTKPIMNRSQQPPPLPTSHLPSMIQSILNDSNESEEPSTSSSSSSTTGNHCESSQLYTSIEPIDMNSQLYYSFTAKQLNDNKQ